jgi:hypothetical protein
MSSVNKTVDFEEGVKASRTQFHDLIYMAANFKAPTSKLEELLPTPKLQPMESKGETDIQICAFEYKKWGRKEQPLPPYNEWTLLIPVTYMGEDKSKLDGAYVVWMPVTHEIPLQGGIDGWGFIKFMSDIGFTETKDSRTCDVSVDGKQLISFTVKKAELSDYQQDMYVYNEMKGMLTRTLVQFKGDFGLSSGDGSGSFILGDHLIAKQIASIDVERTSYSALNGVNVRANLHAYHQTLPL